MAHPRRRLPRYNLFHLLMTVAAAFTVAAVAPSGPALGASPDPAPRRVEMTAGSYYFRPDRIVVEKDVPVELVISSDSYITPHNFVTDSPEAGMEIKVELTRTPKTVRLTPTRTGTYSFYCDRKFLFFKSHREHGMEGVIEVVERSGD